MCPHDVGVPFMVNFREYFSVSWILDSVWFEVSSLCVGETAFLLFISSVVPGEFSCDQSTRRQETRRRVQLTNLVALETTFNLAVPRCPHPPGVASKNACLPDVLSWWWICPNTKRFIKETVQLKLLCTW